MGKNEIHKNSSDSIESESKYLLGPGALSEVLKVVETNVNKGKLLIAGVRDVLIEDKYFDTTSFLMAANNLCLRLRTQPDRPTKLTLKQEAREYNPDSPVYQRFETERVANASNTHTVLSNLPWTPTVMLSSDHHDAQDVLTDFGFNHVFTLYNRRRIYTLVTQKNTTVELSIDKGEVRSGKVKSKLKELELELLTGSQSELIKLSERLERKVSRLQRSPSSKYQRGLSLLSQWKYDPNWVTSEKEAWRTELNKIFTQLQTQIRGVLTTESVKSVHKTRVNIRRILTLLEFLNYSSKSSNHIEKQLRSLQKALGVLRDYDIMGIHYQSSSSHPDTVALIDLINLKRTQALSEFRALSAPNKLSGLKSAWKVFTGKPLNSAVNDIHVVHRYERLNDKLSVSLGRYETEVSSKGQFSNEAIRRMHKVRIATKKLRYATEYLTFALPGNAPGRLTNLITAQDSLGKVQDLFTIDRVLGDLKEQFKPLLNSSLDSFISANQDELTRVLSAIDVQKLLRQQDDDSSEPQLRAVKGIGHATEIKLNKAGIHNLHDLKTQVEISFSGVEIDSATRNLCERYNWESQLKTILQEA